jgi:hypothetical protein
MHHATPIVSVILPTQDRARPLRERGCQHIVNANLRYANDELFALGFGALEYIGRVYRSHNSGLRAAESAEEAAEIRLEQQAQRLRRGVARVVGACLPGPVLRVMHSVSWTIRPLRPRLARTQRPG